MKKKRILLLAIAMLSLLSCQKNKNLGEVLPEPQLLSLEDVAQMFTCLPMDQEHFKEVHDAVSRSIENGYDEEYTMSDLFRSPGSGVGETYLSKEAKAGLTKASYSSPLRDLITQYYQQPTRSGETLTAEQYLDYISRSDMQIYWPYAEDWDGQSRPIITFDPLDGGDSNTGWYMDDDGTLKEINVTEKLAKQRPVWVINNNEDAENVSIDVMRKNNPDWAAGGTVVIGGTKATTTTARSLLLKTFQMNRNYDSIFAGGSEFFIKIGSVESFKANKESDIYLYNPSVTDFMIVVRRRQLNQPLELNTLLVAEWTSQLQTCAFMIIEDDGGTTTSWNCNAVVKYNSKSYGFEISIPYKDRDDIVWRGQLNRRYIEATESESGNFGDVQLTFGIREL